jgi:hypothetical protein
MSELILAITIFVCGYFFHKNKPKTNDTKELIKYIAGELLIGVIVVVSFLLILVLVAVLSNLFLK